MRCLIPAVLLILICASLGAAQSEDNPHAEFFAGYSLMRTNYKVKLLIPGDLFGVPFAAKQTINGFDVSVNGYLNKGFSLVGDFSGHFTTGRSITSTGNKLATSVRIINVLGGPQYKFRNESRLAPFVRLLGG